MPRGRHSLGCRPNRRGTRTATVDTHECHFPALFGPFEFCATPLTAEFEADDAEVRGLTQFINWTGHSGVDHAAIERQGCPRWSLR